jgi:hypothetical protein
MRHGCLATYRSVAARCSDDKHGADGLVIVTEWEQFRVLFCDSIRARMVANHVVRRPPATALSIGARAGGFATAFRLSFANYASGHARLSLQKLDISKPPSHLGAEGTEPQSPEACSAPVRLPCATFCYVDDLTEGLVRLISRFCRAHYDCRGVKPNGRYRAHGFPNDRSCAYACEPRRKRCRVPNSPLSCRPQRA